MRFLQLIQLLPKIRVLQLSSLAFPSGILPLLHFVVDQVPAVCVDRDHGWFGHSFQRFYGACHDQAVAGGVGEFAGPLNGATVADQYVFVAGFFVFPGVLDEITRKISTCI